MDTKSRSGSEPAVPELIDGIIRDAEKLIRQQFELLREEVRHDLRQAGDAAAAFGAGAGLLALGGVLSAHMLAHFLHRSTRLPLWASYGAVAATLGAGGAGLLNHARKQLGGVRLAFPQQTTEALKENLAWLKEQATGAPTE